MENRIGFVEEKVGSTEKRVGSVEACMGTMRQDIREVKKDTESIKLRIENEISVNIQRVAEGHLDLSRNLHDAMRPSSEVEMLGIKVRTLESEVKELKLKIS